jgi:hypothetical protein
MLRELSGGSAGVPDAAQVQAQADLAGESHRATGPATGVGAEGRQARRQSLTGAVVPELTRLTAAPEAALDALDMALDMALKPWIGRDIPEGDPYLPVLPDLGGDPGLWLYRKRTAALLRRDLRFSIEVGRLPSLLGREFFRTRVTSYKTGTFEDAVIFVHDVQKCLEKLNEFEKTLIARIVFQDYTQDEAANLMGYQRRTVVRRFPETLDRFSEILLECGLLTRFPEEEILPPESCQEGERDENESSGS